MSADLSIEHILERWFDEGVDQMPDRVYLTVLDRVERQPQQRGWRVPRRDSTVNTYLKLILAVAATLVIAIGGIAIVVRPSGTFLGAAATPSPSPSPSPSAVPSPSPTAAWDDSPQCGEIGCGGPLTAGTYTSTGLKPAVTYTLTTPWVNVRDWQDFFMLYPDTESNRALAAHGDYAPYILIVPGPTTVSPSAACPDESAADEVEVDAAGFADFLTSREGLSATAAPIALSGLSGQEVVVDIEPGWTGCLPMTPLGQAVVSWQYRYIVLDKPDGDSLTILLSYPAPNQPWLEVAGSVVQSFEFDLSQQVSPSPSPTAAWDDSPQCGGSGCGGPLTAGTHTSTDLKPAVTYTLTAPWVNLRDWEDYFVLYPDSPANRAVAAAGSYPPHILVLPGELRVSPTARCYGAPTSDEVPVDAAGFAAAVAARDGLQTSTPVPVAVGGLMGLQFDVRLTPGGTTGCAADVPVLPFGETVAAYDHYRLIVLDVADGGTRLIRLWAPEGAFDAFVAEAMPVVESFKFGLSNQSSPPPS